MKYTFALENFLRRDVWFEFANEARSRIGFPSNIAEGKGRHSHKELVQFLYRARGSLLEIETQLSIAHELGYVDLAACKRLEELMGDEGRILNGLINRFEDHTAKCA